jgi:DNA-binding response OmpR family regulator
MDAIKKIIIIDDEESVLKNLTAFFEDEEFEVLTASSGELGLDLLLKSDITLAIVDIRLPGIDGNTVITKTLKKRPEVYFIIHTGSSDYTLPDELKDSGFTRDRVFFKPIPDLNLLLNAVKCHLS